MPQTSNCSFMWCDVHVCEEGNIIGNNCYFEGSTIATVATNACPLWWDYFHYTIIHSKIQWKKVYDWDIDDDDSDEMKQTQINELRLVQVPVK